MAKYKAYPEYKDSGVESLDTIPKMWSIKKLKYIFEIKKRIAGKIGFDVLSVTQKGIKIKDIESGEGQLSMDYSKYQRVYPGEFAMNHMDLLTGYVDISNYDGVTSPDYRVFTVRDKHSFYSRYYLYLLQDGYKQRRFFHLGQGSAHLGRWRLPTEAFNEIVYPCPSLTEQIHIASFLDHETAKIDNLIEKQRQLIELLKEKRQAVISHAVTKGLNPDVPMKDSGVEWLGEVPEHWTIKRLKHIAPKVGVGLVINPSTYTKDEGVYFIFGGDVKEFGFDLTKTRRISPQDSNKLLPSRLNSRDLVSVRVGYPGITSVVTDDLEGSNCASIIIIRRGSYNSDWLCAAMNVWVGRQQVDLASYGAAQKQFNVSDAIEFVFPVPPINEQNDIAYFVQKTLKKFDDLTQKALKQIELLQERRTALISSAVTGKIDVRDWVAPEKQENEEPQEATA
ncbi:restriction endonuclease subunit S [Pantoea ananatis]|uniref:restriction endonuclease subunit S n=1 Tax=Pantoea ananas TaxID=553 RepID=UPI001059E55B|nr:restriction endonuclease subunit S [Pantoea ananatis]TDL55258.1 restriction endonuclease subunit S [Pantoea ananatis]